MRASPSDDVRCHRCDEPIDAGEWIVRCTLSPRGRSASTNSDAALHLSCAADVHPSETLSLVSADELSGDTWGAQRVALLASLAANAEPLRDRRNRPRVTVKIMGNAATDRAASWIALIEHGRDMAVCSSRAEYVFEPVRHDQGVLQPSDRRRPIAACVLVALLDAPTSTLHEAKVAAMVEAGYAPPVLWVIGEGAESVRDVRVSELRAQLDAAGYEPDEASVLCSDRVDPVSLAALVALLDERPIDRAPLPREQRFELCVDALERALNLEEPTSVALRCERLARHLARHPVRGVPAQHAMEVAPAVAARARAAVTRALCVPVAREAAMDALWKCGDEREVPAVVAMLTAMWSEPLRSLGGLFSKAHGYVRQHDALAAQALLVDGFVHEKTGAQRRKDLAAMLLGARTRQVASMLRDRAPAATRAAAKQAMDLAERIEAGLPR